MPYPQCIMWNDGTETRIQMFREHNYALASCSRYGHEEMPIKLPGMFPVVGCIRCLTLAYAGAVVGMS